MRKSIKALIVGAGLALGISGAYVAAQSSAVISSPTGTVSASSGDGASANISSNTASNVNNSVSSNTSSIITSTNNSGSTSTVVSNNNSMSTCSTDWNGSRCEVTCAAPQVAQCVKRASSRRPSCYCQ